MNAKETEFLKEYERLCRKHGLYLHGCGCCGSPNLIELEEGRFLTIAHGYTGCINFEDFIREEDDILIDGEIKNVGEYIEELEKMGIEIYKRK